MTALAVHIIRMVKIKNIILQLNIFMRRQKMARFISVEIDASQLRVAEIEEVGRKERILQCFSIPMPH